MSMFNRNLKSLALIVLIYPALPAASQEAGLGVAIDADALVGFDLVAPPDGSGFPAGSGTVNEGRQVYNARCAACHAADGTGVSGNTIIVGGDMASEDTPLRTVGSYWPHASTLFDFVRRAMPADAPKSLSDEEVYQVTAYVLYLNGIIDEDVRLDRNTLMAIRMPNADGFIDRSAIQ
ncbi:MAG: cytochrome c [Pseudohongiellaceae bacterium]